VRPTAEAAQRFELAINAGRFHRPAVIPRTPRKSPEDRLALEKEIPSLIVARDKAVTAAKRK
jgi:hypothetical protein